MSLRKGFLLIEMGVTLALLILIIILALPQLSFLHKRLVHSEVEKLASWCYYLRQRALLTHQHQKLIINDLKSYTIDNHIHRLAAGVLFGSLDKSLGPPSDPKVLIRDPITFKNHTIIFYDNGTISSGTLYLTDEQHNHMYALTTPTGQMPYVRIYEFYKKWITCS